VSSLSCFLWVYPLRVSRPLQKQLVQHQNNIWWAFCEYDRDGNGVITAEELAKILGEGEGVGKMISEYDLDHDGMINYEVRASAVWCHTMHLLGPAHAPSPHPAQCVCLRCSRALPTPGAFLRSLTRRCKSHFTAMRSSLRARLML
jgi:hypothetical protein